MTLGISTWCGDLANYDTDLSASHTARPETLNVWNPLSSPITTAVSHRAFTFSRCQIFAVMRLRKREYCRAVESQRTKKFITPGIIVVKLSGAVSHKHFCVTPLVQVDHQRAAAFFRPPPSRPLRIKVERPHLSKHRSSVGRDRQQNRGAPSSHRPTPNRARAVRGLSSPGAREDGTAVGLDQLAR